MTLEVLAKLLDSDQIGCDQSRREEQEEDGSVLRIADTASLTIWVKRLFG